MRRVAVGLFLFAAIAQGDTIDDFLDRLDSSLTRSAFENKLRVRLSGTFDFELYHFEQPAPGLINSSSDTLVNPRLTLFLDAQYGSQFYLFVQSRLDRGFDPSDHGAEIRLDEYALRYTPWEDGRLTVQIGTFATVVGNWVPRHLSWDNPFVNAPLPYENVSAIEDIEGVVATSNFRHELLTSKYEFIPVIWGPSYASGIAISGKWEKFDYAVEMKNAPLSSRPESWHVTEIGFENPAFNGRIGYRPDQAWNFGISGGEGVFFRPEAERMLPPVRDISDYRQYVLGQDASFALHHLQLWAEFYEARFELPHGNDADTFAYYFEAKYKFTPQFFGAVRWNQQFYGDIENSRGRSVRWGQDTSRIEFAGAYRFNSHTQLKVQYGFQATTNGGNDQNHILSAQFTIRF